jgi:hypothetical protein
MAIDFIGGSEQDSPRANCCLIYAIPPYPRVQNGLAFFQKD